MSNGTTQNTPQRQIPLHLLLPHHFSNGDILLAIGAKHRCAREGVLVGNDLAALTRVMNTVIQAASPPVGHDIRSVWMSGPIEIVIPRDLAVEDLFLTEHLIVRLRAEIPQLEVEVVEKLIKMLANAYRWEIGKGPAPEPVIPADACADLDHTWVETYMVYRWTTRKQIPSISSSDLATLTAQHFGIREEDALPFRTIAEEVTRFYTRSGNQPMHADEE